MFSKKYFNEMVGFFSVLLISTQGFFIMQSSTILPEIAIAFWSLLSFYYFFQEKWVFYFLTASCLLLTKESGLTCIISLPFCNTINTCILKQKFINFFKQSIRIASPIIPLLVFFTLQKIKYGWIFYPEHIGFIDTRLSIILLRFKDFKHYLFVDDMHKAFSLLFVFSFIFYLYKNKGNYFYGFKNKIFTYLIAYVFFYLLFCSINFFTLRYLITALFILIFCFSYCLYFFIPQYYKWFALLLSTVVFIKFCTNLDIGENKLGMYDSISVSEKGIQWIEKNIPKSESVRVDDFVIHTQLTNWRAGFRTDTIPYTNVISYTDSNNKYVVISSQDGERQHSDFIGNANMQLLKNFTSHKCWFEIWLKK